MAKIDVMPKQKDEQQFAYIFLLLIAVQRFVTFEFASDVGQLLVDTLDFSLFAFAYCEMICVVRISWTKKLYIKIR